MGAAGAWRTASRRRHLFPCISTKRSACSRSTTPIAIVLEEWLDSACEHPGMRLVFERINNWAGVRVFQEALRRLGPEQFPTVLAEIPSANGGSTSAEAAALALDELERFRRADAAWARPVLLDETDEGLCEYVASYGGLFMFAAGLQAGPRRRGSSSFGRRTACVSSRPPT